MKKIFFLILLIVFTTVLHSAERKAMSLVLMVDGLRPDAPGNLNMINFLLLKESRWHPEYRTLFADNCRCVPDAPPDSAPNHAAIMTGVSAAKNGVFANRMTMHGKFSQWKPYLLRLTEAGAIKKGSFFFLWWEDARYPLGNKVSSYRNLVRGLELWQKDEDCVTRLIAELESENTPESLLMFFDNLDHKGHKGGRVENGVQYGFYPYSRGYVHAAALTDWWIGNILQAVRRRKTFDKEDWLIIICADHGGFGCNHGEAAEEMARTTPLLVVSRHIPVPGEMAKVPALTDIAPTVLKHHGIEVAELDGKPVDYTAVIRKGKTRELSDGLICYLPFDEKCDANAAGSGTVTKSGDIDLVAGRLGKAADFRRDGGFLNLGGSDFVKYENKDNFTVTFWLKSSDLNDGESVIFENKDRNGGRNSGLAFLRRTQALIDYKNHKKVGREIFYMFDAGVSAATGKKVELRKMHPVKERWLFFAITNNGKNCYAFQGFIDGNLYWMSAALPEKFLADSKPWTINPDIPGKRSDFQMDDFAVWNRSLTIDEIKNIFISGTGGISIGDLIRKK